MKSIRKLLLGIGIVALVAILVIILSVLCPLLIALFFHVVSWATTELEIHTDIANYQTYIGENAEKKYRDKFDMDESIFPQTISEDMYVEDYKMVYYNPWDPQYLSYLVVQYEPEDYAAEANRLQQLPVTEYEGYYGVTGFHEQYDLLAMNADPYYGFIYALSDRKDRIIYVEILFCNHFMNLEYQEYIDETYLPIGFDASVDNEYRKTMLDQAK